MAAVERRCESCGAAYTTTRPQLAKYCSGKCRKRAADQREAQRAADVEAANPQVSASGARPTPSTELVERLSGELEAAGRLDTVAGRQALLLARRLEDPLTSFGAAAASLSKELREVLAEAMAGVAREGDPVDELRARRERKHLA